MLAVGKKRSNKAWVGNAMKKGGRDYGNALRGGPNWGMSRVKRGIKRKRRKRGY